MFVTVFISAFILGVLVTLGILFLLFRKFLSDTTDAPSPRKPQFVPFQLPKELISAISDIGRKDQKESCVTLNLLIHFLFKELRDAKAVRRWVINKMNVEFAELMQKTTGRIIDQITVQDFNLGPSFPILKTIGVKDVKLENNLLDQVDVEVDLHYGGGFQIAVEVDMVFGKRRVYLSVTVTRLQGRARLQFTHTPYTHWSFSFYEEPQIEFDVESKYGSKALPSITALIITQLKRIIRKRHTLPNYKFRMKPFFQPPPSSPDEREVNLKGTNLGQGHLEVTIKSCSRLIDLPSDSTLYCTLSVDSLPWQELRECRRKLWVGYDIEIVKGQSTSIGLTFKDEFVLEKYEDIVMIDSIQPDTPAGQVDIKKGDILVSVGQTRVKDSRHAAKLFKASGDRLTLHMERLRTKVSPDLQFTEDTANVKSSEGPDDRYLDSDEYVNIVLQKSEAEAVVNDSNSSEKYDDQVKDVKNTNIRSEVKDSKEGMCTQTQSSSMNKINSQGQNIPKCPQKTSSQGQNITSSPQRKVLSIVNSGRAFLQRRGRSQTQPEVSPKKTPSPQLSQKHSPQPIRRNTSDKDLKDLPSSLKRSGKEADSRSRSVSDTTSVKSCNLDELFDTQSSELDGWSEEEGDDDGDMIQTVEIPTSSHPEWNEKFNFSIGAAERYLNVCVWCKVPTKLDKNGRVLKPTQDFIVGHVCLSLLDVSLDCLMTLQGDNQLTVQLSPSETRAGASRAKLSSYAGHPGFNANYCHGDITLAFVYKPSKMAYNDRRSFTKSFSLSKVKDRMTTERPVESEQGETGLMQEDDGDKHDFERTTFTTVTYCDFCGKKIWFKTAFQCSHCSMKCHKKCAIKCQAETVCTTKGAMKRSNPEERWTSPVSQSDERKIRQEVTQRTASIINKFRKESGDKKADKTSKSIPAQSLPVTPDKSFPHHVSSSNQLSPYPSPASIRRRNSAPDPDALPAVDQSDSISLPQTKSSNSLAEILRKPGIRRNKSAELSTKDKHSGYESSDDSDIEMDEMIQLAQQHRTKGQNLDEMVVMAAKEMGKELFAELSLEERKRKLDSMVMKLQKEIDSESENANELTKAREETVDRGHKVTLTHQIDKSKEKVEAMMMMMLHYCAGLQYCMDQEEEEKQRSSSRKQSEAQLSKTLISTGDADETSVSKDTRSEPLVSEIPSKSDVDSEANIELCSSNLDDGAEGIQVCSVGAKNGAYRKSQTGSDIQVEGGVFDLDIEGSHQNPSITVEHVSCSNSSSDEVLDGMDKESSAEGGKTDGHTRTKLLKSQAPHFLDEYRIKPDESELDDELLSSVFQSVTEIIEASEGDSDTSEEDLVV